LSQDQFLMMVRMALQIAGTALFSQSTLASPNWQTASGAILALAGVGWTLWARREAGLKSSVSAIPNTAVVTTKPTGNPAADTAQTANVAAKIATLSEVKSVISTPEVAAATVSDKVVSGTNTAPATP
jgi:hypothetical protein